MIAFLRPISKDRIQMSTRIILSALFIGALTLLRAQTPDTIANSTLREFTVARQRETRFHLQPVANGYIWSGKKNEVISVQNLDAVIAEKVPRQVFSKVPGVFVYDMDGAGNQTNISTRGLDPHRGWEYNIRVNGAISNSDIYGYPASHFSLPFEAVARIEMVRGTGALQYGAQFGGMLNYVMKGPDTTRVVSWETVNSIGSYGLMSTYHAVGGAKGKLSYQAWYSRRISSGYRSNSESDYDGQGTMLHWRPGKKFDLRLELMRSNYLYHNPGPLTDAMFAANPRQSTRTRNYFNPEIWLPSAIASWHISENTLLKCTISGVRGERRSVLFDRVANIPDTINASTLQYNRRQVDIDAFNSNTVELRLLHAYNTGAYTHHLSVAVQGFYNDLNRRQQGRGTTGSDADFSIDPQFGWGRDLHLRTQNISLAVENRFVLGKFSVIPGFRYEYGSSDLSGTTTYYNPEELPNRINRSFPLFGLNGEWQSGKRHTVYGGFSQAYRPVLFKDIIPATIYERSDKNLEDSYGYNLDLGWRGSAGPLRWDITVFRLQYNNRPGSVARYESDLDTFVLFRTNIGDSRTNGAEIFTEYQFYAGQRLSLSFFTSTALFNARYLGDSLRLNARENRSIAGNRVESVPDLITRNGLTIRYRNVSCSVLYSYTGATFADPFNTEIPSPTAAAGKVPSYGLVDINATWRYRRITARMGISNLMNRQYFTKRPQLYPGPGVWPSDGRSITASVGIIL